MHRLIWNSKFGQCPFVVLNQSENGKYNLISVWFNKISKRFLSVHVSLRTDILSNACDTQSNWIALYLRNWIHVCIHYFWKELIPNHMTSELNKICLYSLFSDGMETELWRLNWIKSVCIHYFGIEFEPNHDVSIEKKMCVFTIFGLNWNQTMASKLNKIFLYSLFSDWFGTEPWRVNWTKSVCIHHFRMELKLNHGVESTIF